MLQGQLPPSNNGLQIQRQTVNIKCNIQLHYNNEDGLKNIRKKI